MQILDETYFVLERQSAIGYKIVIRTVCRYIQKACIIGENGIEDVSIDGSGETPVENVFIVGNDSLGTLNESYKAYVTYGGCAQGWALTSGRLAGANAAAAFAG